MKQSRPGERVDRRCRFRRWCESPGPAECSDARRTRPRCRRRGRRRLPCRCSCRSGAGDRLGPTDFGRHRRHVRRQCGRHIAAGRAVGARSPGPSRGPADVRSRSATDVAGRPARQPTAAARSPLTDAGAGGPGRHAGPSCGPSVRRTPRSAACRFVAGGIDGHRVHLEHGCHPHAQFVAARAAVDLCSPPARRRARGVRP